MLLRCTHMATVGVKGLTVLESLGQMCQTYGCIRGIEDEYLFYWPFW